MLSFVSAVSVNLIVSISTPASDSARVLAANDSRTDSNASAHVRATAASSTRHPAIESTVLKTAARYVGTQYRMGGSKPGAFDCSGFVRYVFNRHGVELPRTANDQSLVGHSIVVGIDSLEAGDLLFFKTPRGQAGHVAIYVGAGKIIHASAGSRRVRYDDLSSPRGKWFIDHLSGVRRIEVQSETKIASR
jgi:peptidoglycan endopeptidase LytE